MSYLIILVPALLFRSLRLTRNWQKLWRVLLFNFSLLISLLLWITWCGETWLRYFFIESTGNGIELVTQRFVRDNYILNNFGLRDNRTYALTPSAGKMRISFIGDSFANGHGIANVEDRFSNIIATRNNGWEVYNLSRDGYSTQMEIDALKDLHSKGYKTDCLVLIYFINDIIDLVPQEADAKKIYETGERPILSRISYFFSIIHARLRELEIGNAENISAADPDKPDFYDPAIQHSHPAMWIPQKDRLLELQQVVEKNGSKFGVAIIPYLDAEEIEYPFRAVNDSLQSFFRRNGVPVMDLLPVIENSNIPGRELVASTYDYHPGEKAHLLFAGALESFLRGIVE